MKWPNRILSAQTGLHRLLQKTEAGRVSALDENKKHLAVGTLYTNAPGNASLLSTDPQRFLLGSKNCIGDVLKLDQAAKPKIKASRPACTAMLNLSSLTLEPTSGSQDAREQAPDAQIPPITHRGSASCAPLSTRISSRVTG